jgi:hypothetical protein
MHPMIILRSASEADIPALRTVQKTRIGVLRMQGCGLSRQGYVHLSSNPAAWAQTFKVAATSLIDA